MAQRGEGTWTWRLFGKTDKEKTLVRGHPFCCRQLFGEGAIFSRAGRLHLPPFARLLWKVHCINFSQEAF